MNKLQRAAQLIMQRSFELQKNETVLIIADDPYLDLAQILFSVALKRTRHVHLLQVDSQYLQKKHICASVANMMREMNVIIALTTVSISHTPARREANRAGARIVTMPAITNNTFARIADMDLARISRLSRKLADILTIAKEIRVTAPNGTNLYLSAAHCKGYADTGLVNVPGSFCNLPCGEACLAPEAGKTEGEWIVDSGMGVTPEDPDRLIISVRDGRAARILGSESAQRLRRRLTLHGPAARHIAEFGIGTNHSARISGYALEDEKVLGTVHMALGNDVSFGGHNDVPIHLDAVVYKATVVIDGRKILDNGKLIYQ
ncbi:aminopeptidase [candidate division KSB1 bacterium]|nr:aminopeptidase [candidate division KSB1 bacterium]